ncbi:hypothetical protein ADIS_4321 [Lunatimonas lonarensis]|uniref:Secreted protein n=1 Tax=Lunatimonas lonarensis TaxID=1232681 RepID=R7ZM29_9BACT|nr:hypothetical protein [Lunatimonas lonarensis]EON75150.1 hypothetical protein ADIS_4321 [Lunatimonas lonarensis]
MKKLLILALVCGTTQLAYAQIIEDNTPRYINSFKRFIESNPLYFSDTLEFILPNASAVMVYFNPDDYHSEEIEEKIAASLKYAVNFPEQEVRNYYLHPSFWESQLDFVRNDIKKKYAVHRVGYTLGIPVGLDFVGGRFAPEMGFRIMADLKTFGFGASVTNTSFFTEKTAGGVIVHHNPFMNLEFDLNPYKRATSTIQAGYLLQSSGPIFLGDTFRIAYRSHVRGNIQLNAGLIFTNNVSTVLPMVGIRFF